MRNKEEFPDLLGEGILGKDLRQIINEVSAAKGPDTPDLFRSRGFEEDVVWLNAQLAEKTTLPQPRNGRSPQVDLLAIEFSSLCLVAHDHGADLMGGAGF